jgi:hypothetical protein
VPKAADMSSITSADSDPDHQDAWVDDFSADSGGNSALLAECVADHRYGWNLQLLLEQAQRPDVLAAGGCCRWTCLNSTILFEQQWGCHTVSRWPISSLPLLVLDSLSISDHI